MARLGGARPGMTSRPIGRSLVAGARAPLSGGGGHGGAGHHGGGRGRGGWWGGPGWWGGGPWYGDYGPDVFIVSGDASCPDTFAPVKGSDGVVYQNACVAQKRGVKVMTALGGFSVTVDDQDQTPGATLGFWVGVAAGAIGTSLLRAILR